jgi:hypothetical protein
MFYFKNNKDETYSVGITHYPGNEHFSYTLALGNIKPIKFPALQLRRYPIYKNVEVDVLIYNYSITFYID